MNSGNVQFSKAKAKTPRKPNKIVTMDGRTHKWRQAEVVFRDFFHVMRTWGIVFDFLQEQGVTIQRTKSCFQGTNIVLRSTFSWQDNTSRYRVVGDANNNNSGPFWLYYIPDDPCRIDFFVLNSIRWNLSISSTERPNSKEDSSRKQPSTSSDRHVQQTIFSLCW